MDRILEGTVDRWTETGCAAGFGFLAYELGHRIATVYFDYASIAPNNIGVRAHGKIVGNLVRFRTDKHLYQGEKKDIARDVQSIFATDVENPADHREVSIVDHIVRGKSGIASVFLKRASGDELYLCQSNVADDHKDRFNTPRAGQHVWSGVKAQTGNQRTWLATVAEFYSPKEEAAMREEEQCLS